MEMQDKLKLNPGDKLKFTHSKSKGSMAETDIDYYSIINSNGEVVGEVVHEDHTSLNGFRRTQHVRQTDMNGNVIVREAW